MKFLLCPKCGVHRFFVKKNGVNIYFYVDFGGKLVPTSQSNSDLSTVNPEEIFCSGCSWSGRAGKLVKFF